MSLLFDGIRDFLHFSYKRKSNRPRKLMLRTLAILERDEFEGFMRGAGQMRRGAEA